MDLAARIVGYGVIGGLGLTAIAFLLLLAWRYFPVRWNWAIRTPSLLKTPNGVYAVDLLVGPSSRGKTKWFFGLLVLVPGQEPEIVSRTGGKQ